MQKENLNIISLADFKRIPSISILDDDVMVVRTNDIPYIPKPTYPVRIKYFLFVYCTNGSIEFSIDTKKQIIHEGEFILTASDSVLEFHKINDAQACILVVSHKYMKSITVQCANIWKQLASITRHFVLPTTEHEQSLIFEYINKIAQYCSNDKIKYRNEIICHQILSFLHEICGFDSVADFGDDVTYEDRNQEIYSEFMKLVIHNFKTEHSVNFYAQQMNLTPKYLSVCVKAASSKGPSECIQKFLIQEAMVLLKNTNMTMKEIVAELNFPTATFFCRYFKRYTGTTPNEYRTKSL